MSTATVNSLHTDLDQQIRQLEARLLRERTGVPPAVVRECVQRAWARFAEARVVAFVPILVERAVRAQLQDAIPDTYPPSVSLQDWARSTAERLLARELPRRWAHTQGVAHQADRVAGVLPREEAQILIASAWLHDIGYAEDLANTGCHQLDGARYLLTRQVPARVCALVAHHAGAAAVASLTGLGDELAAFVDEQTQVRDALWYCDMITSPDGELMSCDERQGELRARRSARDPVVQALEINGDERVAAVRRTQELLRRNGFSDFA